MPDASRGLGNGDATLRRLERLEERQTEIIERLASNSGRLTDLQEDVKALVAEIGGAPEPHARGPRDTLRYRLHQLENSAYAAEYAKQALEAAQSAADSAAAKQWSVLQKVGLFIFAFLGAAGTLLTVFGYTP